MIAGDEMRHHHTISLNQIFKIDPEMMLAFQYMMKLKLLCQRIS
jgi:hypothetical protein